jgi:hypothetical protein
MNSTVVTTKTAPMPQSAADASGLRDLFAAHAVAALIVAPKQPGVPKLEGDKLAQQSYEIADAMMRARGG